MASPFLTKTDFKVAADCRTKLYYRKSGYPTNIEENDYLRFLADGGFMIEFIAKARFPSGIDLVGERAPVASFVSTQRLLAAGDVVVFEAAATIGKFHVRADVLEKVGNVLNLIEVKSSSIEDDQDDANSPFLTKRGTIVSRWKEYLVDLAFQTHVFRLAFPELTIRPHLCVVNKGQLVSAMETLGNFHLSKDAKNPKARPEIRYSGDTAKLRNSRLLAIRPTQHEVDLIMPEVVAKAEALAALLSEEGPVQVQEDIAQFYRECRKCEFRHPEKARSGFHRCWGKLAESPYHILDLHRVGQIGSVKVEDPVSPLLRRGSASYLDLGLGDLGNEGAYQARRLMQLQSMRAGGTEHLPRELMAALAEHEKTPGFPLHFVDFEACDLSLPHHAGLKPYERVAFQWSCHTISADGSLSHREWLNTEREFPNFHFVRTLAECIGDKGTVYVWSPYEQTTLKKVLQQIGNHERSPFPGTEAQDQNKLEQMAKWIEALLGPEDATGKHHSSRIRDLHKLASEYYFHPRMSGRTSIKVVLPAVWESNDKLRRHPWFANYLSVNADGKPVDPYKSLPPLPFGDEDESDDVVTEGTGAIRVYQDLIFSDGSCAQDAANRRQLLLQYCRLDTAAMVMIWMHWTGRA